MRKLKTPEQIMNENNLAHLEDYPVHDEVKSAITAAQRDALECAAENGEVINEGTYGADGQSTDYYVLDKSSILNLIPKEEMKELSKEDQERIEKIAANDVGVSWPIDKSVDAANEIDEYEGLVYWMIEEHKIAFEKGKIEGFNEGIEAVRLLLAKMGVVSGTLTQEHFKKEIEKLKKPTLK